MVMKLTTIRHILTKSIAVAKKADRTAYDLRYSCRAELPKIPHLE